MPLPCQFMGVMLGVRSWTATNASLSRRARTAWNSWKEATKLLRLAVAGRLRQLEIEYQRNPEAFAQFLPKKSVTTEQDDNIVA